MSATQSNVDRDQPSYRKRRAALVVLVLLVLPALAICCAVGALQTRSDDPPLADYTLGPLGLHSTPVYVSCPAASTAPCFARWYVIHVLVELPTLGTWGFDIWAPFVDSQAQAGLPATLAMWYHVAR